MSSDVVDWALEIKKIKRNKIKKKVEKYFIQREEQSAMSTAIGVALALGAMAAPSTKPNFIFLLMDDCEYPQNTTTN